jgi:glycosyltransferase involved in cell wall biosynthesis
MRPSDRVTVAFVGAVVPDEPRFHLGAFSPAGNLAVRNVIVALANAGVPVNEIVSFLPIPKWPRSTRLWVGSQTVEVARGRSARLVSFLNVAVAKELWIGMSVLAMLIRWGWRNRSAANRLIYVYNLTVPPGIFVWIASKATRSKLVAMVFDINQPGQTVPRTIASTLDWWCHQFLIPRLDGLVAITDAIASDLRRGRSYLRIEGGIADSEKMEQPLSKPGSTDAPFTIVAAGQLNDANGIGLLLEAFAGLKGRSYRLRIAGSGPLTERVKAAAMLDDRLEYCGFLPRAEVLRLYRTADALVSVRLHQSTDTKYLFPSKLMEYFASGVPVITTAVGNIGAEYRPFCVVVKDDPTAVASGIEFLAALSDSDRTELGRRARRFMLMNKTWNAQGERIWRYIADQVLPPHTDGSRTCTRASEAPQTDH